MTPDVVRRDEDVHLPRRARVRDRTPWDYVAEAEVDECLWLAGGVIVLRAPAGEPEPVRSAP